MIEVNNLSFTYPKAKAPTLKGLNFSIAKGEIFGFLGPSGAGKSTAQKVLYKILPGYSGDINIDGKPLANWGKEYFEQIGVGFELPNHYLKLTGKENLELFASFYPKENMRNLPELFELVGLEDAINQKVSDYSKGMKMRLNFIRAIMHNPSILFFDEPTSGLDPANAFKIKELINELKAQGKTIFITTHNMDTADQLCDRVSFIVDGEIRITEEPAVLKHQHGEHKVVAESKTGQVKEFEIEQLGSNSSFLEFIKNNELESINSKDATLEQVFMNVTGKALKI
ncbi:MAG: ABC transporter ATP-binding protein [Bacteroidetes bacterium]|nr:ABC transporter ATP-binding protein [Bacteroidota bacterium]